MKHLYEDIFDYLYNVRSNLNEMGVTRNYKHAMLVAAKKEFKHIPQEILSSDSLKEIIDDVCEMWEELEGVAA